MADNTTTQPSETSDTPLLSLRITEELHAKINRSADASKMPRSAMLRLAIDRGIDRLLEQLESTPDTQP